MRHLGLWGATGVGVGAIVGGGILALAGVALQAAGPSAMVAFALNGAIAVATALSFAELGTAFPESGGCYTFARRLLSIRNGFAVGWVLWSAYLVAAVLYALGFAFFAIAGAEQLLGFSPGGRALVLLLALAATGAYTVALSVRSGGGGQWATLGKLVVFTVLVVAGLWKLGGAPEGPTQAGMTPFWTGGAGGVLAAMGGTFIALQGFDLVAAVAGEVKDPARTIPRAMLLSLGAALLVYLPLLFVVSTVGNPGGDVAALVSSPVKGALIAVLAGAAVYAVQAYIAGWLTGLGQLAPWIALALCGGLYGLAVLLVAPRFGGVEAQAIARVRRKLRM